MKSENFSLMALKSHWSAILPRPFAGLGQRPSTFKKDLTMKTEQFSSATQLGQLVAHVNQLVDRIKTGHLSAHNEALYRAELSRLREVLGLVDNRPV